MKQLKEAKANLLLEYILATLQIYSSENVFTDQITVDILNNFKELRYEICNYIKLQEKISDNIEKKYPRFSSYNVRMNVIQFLLVTPIFLDKELSVDYGEYHVEDKVFKYLNEHLFYVIFEKYYKNVISDVPEKTFFVKISKKFLENLYVEDSIENNVMEQFQFDLFMWLTYNLIPEQKYSIEIYLDYIILKFN